MNDYERLVRELRQPAALAQNAGEPQCVDCGRKCPPQGRCAAECGQWVCDDCYLRHCEDGCKAVAR